MRRPADWLAVHVQLKCIAEFADRIKNLPRVQE
jgi:hypothetical protein